MTPDPRPLGIQNSTGHSNQWNALPRRPQTTHGSLTAGRSHPQTGSKRRSHRQRNTADASRHRQAPHIARPCRNAATSPQPLQHSPTAHAHSPPAGPYTPNLTTPPRGELTACTNLESLNTGRVPGQPGLARPPALQDHNREGETPRPRAPTPQIRLARYPQDRPAQLRATGTTRNSVPIPELADPI